MKIREEAKKMKLKQKKRTERGSITLFVLIAMMFFLMVGMIIFITTMNSSSSQKKDVSKISSEYNTVDQAELDRIYDEQLKKQTGELVIVLIDKNGKVYTDNVWLKGSEVDTLPLSARIIWPKGLDEEDEKTQASKKIFIKDLSNPDAQEIEVSETQFKNFEISKSNGDINIEISATVNGQKTAIRVKIDTIAPEIGITGNDGILWLDPTKNETQTTLEGTVVTSDNLSGVKNIKYVWTTNPEAPLADDVIWDTNDPIESGDNLTIAKGIGEYYLHTRVIDEAGNVKIETSEKYDVRKALYATVTGGITAYSDELVDAVGHAAASGSTINVLESNNDISTVSIGKDVTINTNGKTVTMDDTITVASAGKVTFTGNGTFQRTVEEGVRGDLIANSGEVVVGTQNAQNGPTLKSKDIVIWSGNVTVYSGNITSLGKSATTGDNAGIYARTINVYGGNVSNDNGSYGIVISATGTGTCNISGGRVSGKVAICPTNGTLTVSGAAEIVGRSLGVANSSDSHKYTLIMTGGTITSTNGSAIQSSTDVNITIKGGNIKGSNGINVTGGNSTVTIGDSEAAFTDANRNVPVIQGKDMYGVRLTNATSKLNYYNGKILGKEQTNLHGVNVAFSAAGEVEYREGYGAYTQDETVGSSTLHATTLVKVEMDVTQHDYYLNTTNNKTGTITVTGEHLGTIEYTSSATNIAEVSSSGVITAKAEGKAVITVKDLNSGVTATVEVFVDTTAPTITANPATASSVKSVNITLTAADVDKGASTSGLATNNVYEYAVSTSNATAPTTGWTTYTSGTAFTIGGLDTDTYYVWVKEVKDKATNKSVQLGNKVGTYHVFGPYVLDTTPPEVIITGQATGVTDGLMRYYDGNNNLGNGHSNNTTTWKDLTGTQTDYQENNVHNVTFSNDGYASFNGTNSWVNLGEYHPTTAVTVEAEVTLKSIQSGTHNIIVNTDSSGCGLALYDGKPGISAFINGDYRRAILDEVLDINRTYHIAGTYDGTALRLYIDGIEHATLNVSGEIKSTATSWVIGADADGTNGAGQRFANINVYATRIYSRALTANEIKQNMNADRIKPGNKGSSNLSTNDDSVTLSIIFNEDVKGLTADDFVVKGYQSDKVTEISGIVKGELTKISDSEYTLPISNIPGSSYFNVELLANSYTDLADNEGPGCYTKRYRDSYSPNITITAVPNENPTAANSIEYTITSHEATTGFSADDIQVTNGTKGTYTRVNSKTFKIVVTNSESCSQVVSVPSGACYDSKGNASKAASKTVVIDHTGPTVTFEPNGNTTYGKTQTAKVTVADAASTVDTSSLKYKWTQSTTAPAEADFTQTFTNGENVTSPENLTGNNWYLWIYTKDVLGNTTIIKSNVFYLDNTPPTLSLTKETYQEGFDGWTLQDGASIDDDGILILPNDSSSATSKNYRVNGEFWYSIFDGYTSTLKPSSTLGGLSWTSYYYNDNLNPAKSNEGRETNGWSKSLVLNTWVNNINWYDNNSTAINLRFGENVKNVKLEFGTGNDLSQPPVKIRNFKMYGQLYEEFYDITVTSNGTQSDIAKTKYAKGNQNVAYFASNGENVVNNTIRVTENGIYTVYVEDQAGNGAVSTIEVTKIDKTAPVIDGAAEFNGANVSFTAKDIAPNENEAPSGVVGYQITDSSTAPTSGWTNVEVPETTTVDSKKQTSKTINLTNTHLSAGTHYIWIIDAAGHKTSKQIKIYYNITLSPGEGATTTGTTTVKASATTLTGITAPTKTGYTFGGYYTAVNGGGTKYYNADGTPAHTNDFIEDTTLYAKWTANPYTVTADANGGTITTTSGWTNAADNKTATKQVIYDSKYGTLPTVTRTGYTFKNWTGKNQFDESKYTSKSNYTKVDEYYYGAPIQLKPNTTYKVSIKRYNDFDGNIGSYKYLLVSNKSIINDNWSAIVHSSPNYSSTNYIYTTSENGLLYIGYTNLSQEDLDYIWANTNVQIEEGSTATAYEPYTVIDANTVVKTAANHKIYAKWEANKYTVKFNKNANDAIGLMSDQTFTYNETQNLKQNGYVRLGCTFNGWNTKADGTGTNYTDKQSVANLTAENNGVVNLYVKWKETNATFVAGQTFNVIAKKLAGNLSATYESADTNITQMKYATIGDGTDQITLEKLYEIRAQAVEPDAEITAQTKYVKVSVDAESETPIYMWYENGKLYWFSEDLRPALNTDASYMFNNMQALTGISELNKFDTSHATNMEGLFKDCRAVTSLDVSGFNTAKVTNMSNMFKNCSAISQLDVSGFNTAKVTTFGNMFYGCSTLTSLTINRPTNAVSATMNYMFTGCSGLTSIVLTGFHTQNVTSMQSMFQNCTSLSSLDVSGFDTSSVTNMFAMFNGCSNLTSIDVTSFNTSNVRNMRSMFYNCRRLTKLDLTSFNTSSVTNMWKMFAGCNNLTTIYATDSFVTTALTGQAIGEGYDATNTTSSHLFEECTKLVGGSGTVYDSSKIDKTYARIDNKGTDSNGNILKGYFTNHFFVEFNKNHESATGEMTKQGIPFSYTTKLKVGTFARQGYTFVGWNTKADGTGTNIANQADMNYDLAGIKAIAQNTTDDKNVTLTLYAKWMENNYENLTTHKMYDTLTAALAEAQNGQTIQVKNSRIETAAPVVAAGKSVTIDMNGQETTLNQTLTVEATATATFIDSGTTKGKLKRTSGKLITNAGAVKVGTNSTNGANMDSVDRVIEGGNVEVNSGILNLTGAGELTTNFGVLWSNNITINGGEIINNYKHYGLLGYKTITITGGKVKGKDWGIHNGSTSSTLSISGNAEIIGETSAGIISYAADSTITVAGGTITGGNIGIAIPASKGTVNISGGSINGGETGIETRSISGVVSNQDSINVTGGSVTGGTDGIHVITGSSNNIITIGNNTNLLDKEKPIIQGTSGYSINIEGTSSTLNFYDGKLIGGKHDKTFDGRDVTFNVANGTTVNPLTGYKPYTRQNSETNKYETVLEKEVTVTADAVNGTIGATDGWTVAQDSKTATKGVLQNTTYGTLIPQNKMTREGYTFSNWSGKNLFDEESILMGINGATKENNYYTFTFLDAYNKYGKDGNKLPLNNFKANTSYTISITGYVSQVVQGNSGLVFSIYYSDGTRYDVTISDLSENTVRYSTPANKTISKIAMTYGSGGAYKAYIKSIQLEEGSTATTYEPYQVIDANTLVTKGEDHKIYANWTANDYAVTADANGGTLGTTTGWTNAVGNKIAAKTVKYDSAYGTLPSVSRAGYTLDGWYRPTYDTYGSKTSFVDSYSTPIIRVSPDKTSYYGSSQFKANDILEFDITVNDTTITGIDINDKEVSASNYTIEGNNIKGKIVITSSMLNQTYSFLDIHTEAKSSNYTINKFALTKFDSDNKLSDTTIMKTARNHTIFAKWNVVTYNITYNMNGGTNNANNPSTYTVETPTINLQAPTKSNNTFFGWSFNEGSSALGNIVYQDQNTTIDNGTYTFTNTTEGNRYSYSKIQLLEPTGYKFILTINTKAGTGKVYGIYDHKLESGRYAIHFGTNGNKRDTYVDYALNLEQGKKYYYEWENIQATEQEYVAKDFKFVEVTGNTTASIPIGSTGDKTFTAYWYANQYTYASYTATFDVNGGNELATADKTRTLQYSTPLGTLPTPTRTGYDFAGWWTAATGGTQISATTKMGAANVTYYAHWTAKKYTVTANANTGSIPSTTNWTGTGATATKQVTFDSTYGNLPTPTKTGYTFKGWYKENTFTNKVEESTQVTTADNHTIYAKWEANPYTITADAKGGQIATTTNWTGTGVSATKSVTYDSTYGNLPTPTKSGYTFKGWYKETAFTNKVEDSTQVKTASNHTIYAKWEENTYTLTFDANGGNVGTSTKSVTYGQTYTDLPTPTRTGYTFKGWYATFNGSNQKINYGRAYMYTDKISIHISAYMENWSSYKRAISCTEGGGWNIESDSNGYINFACLKSGSGYVSALSSTTKFADLSSGWHDFDIVFDGNNVKGYVDGEVIATSGAYNSGKIGYHGYNSIFVGAEAGASNSTPAGYYFNGYIGNIIIKNDNTIISGTTYNTITAPAQDLTLYAKWEANPYTIKFDKNDSLATGAMADLSMKYDTQKALTANGFSKVGHHFKEWNTKADGTGTSYANGATVNNLATSGEITLYAQWEANDYILTVDPNGGTYDGKTTSSTYTQKYDTVKNIGVPVNENNITVTYDANGGSSAESATASRAFEGWEKSGTGEYVASSKASQKDMLNVTSGRPEMTRTEITENGETYEKLTYKSNSPSSDKWYFMSWPKLQYTSGHTYEVRFKARLNSLSGDHILVRIAACDNETGPDESKYRIDTVSEDWQDIVLYRTISGTTIADNNNNTRTIEPRVEIVSSTQKGKTGTTNVDIKDLMVIDTTTGELLQSNANLFWYRDGNATLTAQYSNLSEVTLPNTSREGYTLKGWYDATTGGNKIGNPGDQYAPTENITLHAQWNPNTYHVTLNHQGATSATYTHVYYLYETVRDVTYNGNTYQNMKYYADSACTNPFSQTKIKTLPVRPGYTFGGYYTETNGGGTQYVSATGEFINDLYKTLGDKTLYAKWTARTDTPYTVKHFKQNIDGTYPSTPADTDSLTGTTDTSVTPARKTYTGFTAPAGQALTIKGDGTAVLEYKYTRNSYTVTYNYSQNGGTSATKTTDTKKFEEAIDLTPTASKSGYTFVGWTDARNGNSHTALTSKNMPAENVTLYAIFKKDITITTYQYKNAKHEDTATLYNKDANVSVTLPTIANKTVNSVEYTARGWSEANTANATIAANSGATVQLNTNKTYYASYQKEMTATFNYWNGTAAATATASAIRYMNYNEVFVQSAITTPDVVTGSTGKESTAFTHVSSTKNGAAATVNTATLTYYAVYSKTVKATLKTYNNQSTEKSETAYAYYDGTTLNASIALGTTGNATKDSVEYTPRHWSTSDAADATSSVALNGTASIINNTTYYASYQKDIEATFNYWTGSAKASKKETKTRYMNYTGTLKQTNYSIPSEAKANAGDYTYKHIATGTATTSAAVTPSTANTTYYTVYTRTLTVEYDGNGGRGTTASQTQTQTMNANGAVSSHNFTLQANAFTRNGYNFNKWALGSVSGTQYAAGATYTFAPAQGASKNAKFYALWTEKTYTLTIKPNGGTLDGSTADVTRNLKYSDVSDINDPTKTGYTFGGWNELSNAAFTDGLASVTKYANQNNSQMSITTLTTKSADNPISGTTKELKISNAGTAATKPGLGGFYKTKQATASHSYVHVFVAKLDAGKYFHYAYNSLGTGATVEWLTSNEGTGEWQTYVYKVNVGTGSPSTFGFIYVSANKDNLWPSSNNTTETGTYTAYVAYNNIFDITNDNTGIGQIDGAGVLTANWTANTYKVVFNKNADSATGTMADQNFTYDTAQNLTQNGFSRPGYTFAGWATSSTGNVAYADKASVNNLTPTNNGTVNLYAKWTANKYTVVFNKNADSATGTMANQEFTYDVAQNLTQNAFSRTGYTFAGWATSASGSVAHTDGKSVSNLTTTANGTVNLYAKWTPITYHITYDLAGGSLPSGKTNPATYTIENGEITLNNPVKAGYTFKGWSGTGLTGNTNTTVKIPTGSTGDRTYTANWDIVTYNISYTLNGGTVASANPTTYTVQTNEITLNNPEKAGWTFTGWSGTGLTGETNTTVKIPKGSTGDRTYTAHFEKEIILTQKHGSTTTTQSYTLKDSETSHEFTLVTTQSSYTGWTFRGWLNDGTPKAPDYEPTGKITISDDKTVYATYSKEMTATFIDYKGTTKQTRTQTGTAWGNNSCGGVGNQWPSVTIPTQDTYTGWSPVGWTTQTAAGAAVAKASGASIQLSSNPTYYGLYTQNVELTYNANNGESTPTKQTGTRKTNSYAISTYSNPSFTLASAIVRRGYDFAGWQVSAPISATKEAGSTITPASGTALTATAQWNIITYTITYDMITGATNDSSNPSSYTVETDDITLKDPSRGEYVFNGWVDTISNFTWTKGFLNLNTGVHETNSSYPNSYYTQLIRLNAGTAYTLSGYGSYAASNIRWRVYNLDGTYKENGPSTNTYTPSTDCFVRVMFFNAPTEAQRTGTTMANTAKIGYKIGKGSTGNKNLVPTWTLANYSVTAGGKTYYYLTLKEAVDKADASGSTITVLTTNSDTSAAFTVSKNVTINTNGKTVTMANAITVASGKTLTINGAGTITKASGDLITNSGTVVVTNATLTAGANVITGGNVTVNSGTLTGGTNAINVTSGSGTVTIGQSGSAGATNTPTITGTTGYGVNITSSTATFNYYSGTIIGKTAGTTRGVETSYNVSGTVNYPSGYGAHTVTESNMKKTTLVQVTLTVSPSTMYLNRTNNTSQTITVTGNDLGTISYTSAEPLTATVNSSGTVSALLAGTTSVTVTDSNSGQTKTVTVMVDTINPTWKVTVTSIE